MNLGILTAAIAATIGKYSDVVTRAVVPQETTTEVPAIRSFFYTGGQYVDNGEGGHVFRGQMYVEKLVPNFLNKPDGGRGWASRFISQGYELYIVDQTFRGRSTWLPSSDTEKPIILSAEAIEAAFTNPKDHMLWPQAVNHTQWPGTGVRGDPVFDAFYASNVQFVDNSTNQQTAMQAAGAALLDKIGRPAILLGHSEGSFMPTLIADKRPELTKAIVLLEAAGPPFKDEIFNFGGEHPRPWGLWDIPITYDPPVTDPKTELIQK
ncbi:hypothetical protein ACLX1H_003411 [Fusarium chlamydosporum]